MMLRLKWSAALLGATLLTTACPEPEEPEQMSSALVTATANANVETHLDALARLLTVYEASNLVAEVFPKSQAPCASGTDCPAPVPGADLSVDEEVAETKKFLADNVFNEANVEATDATTVTYRISGALVCPKTAAAPNVDPVPEPDCLNLFTELAFRLIVSEPAPGDLAIALKVGDAHPADLNLGATRVALALDLAGIKAAVNAISTTLGEEPVPFPQTFAGRVELALVQLSADSYRAGVSVLEQVRVADRATTDPEYLDVTVAPAADALSVTLDRASRTAHGSLALAAVDVAVALDLFDPHYVEVCTGTEGGSDYWCESSPGTPREGVLEFRVAGASGTADLSVPEDELRLTGVGLGNATSIVKYQGVQILGIDLNAASGRTFDLTVTDAADGPIVKVQPSFELALALAFNSLQSQYEAGELSPWTLDSVLGLKLDGATEPTVQLLENADVAVTPCDPDGTCEPPVETLDKLIRVIAGRLTLSGTGVETVVVEAPGCVVESGLETTDDSHPWLELAAGSCE